MGRAKTQIDKWWNTNAAQTGRFSARDTIIPVTNIPRVTMEIPCVPTEQVRLIVARYEAMTTPPPLGTDSKMEEGME